MLPETRYIPLLIPNPDKSWWQFWKADFVQNPEHPLVAQFIEPNQIVADLPWKEAE